MLKYPCGTTQVLVSRCDHRLDCWINYYSLKVALLSKSLSVAHVKYASLTPKTQTFRQGVTGQSIIHRRSNPRSLPPAGQFASLKDFSSASLLLILLC